MGILDNIDKHLDHRVRLGIMSILMVNDAVEFKEVKRLLDITDGNLASHAKKLEEAAYIKVEKSFVGRKPNTKYIATRLGKAAFKKHIQALEDMIHKNKA